MFTETGSTGFAVYRALDRRNAIWTGRTAGIDTKRGSPKAWNISVLYIPP